MSEKPCVIGVDIGTSSCKTLAIDEHGEVLATEVGEYPVQNLRPGWSEQDPDAWWEAVKGTLREVTRKAKEKGRLVEGIGLTGQMHGLVLLDAEGRTLRPCIMWNDQRSAPYCTKIHEIVGGEREFLKIVNNAMLPGYTGGKLLWVWDNEPQVFEKAVRFLCPKDYIRYKLTGVYATDVTDASGTGLFDVKERKWAVELIKELKLPLSMFPLAFESHEKTGSVVQEVAEGIGVKGGTPVFAGGGDAVVQNIGVGAVEPNVLSITLGTAGIVAIPSDTFLLNPGGTLQFFCNAIPDGWIVFGTTLAAGGSLRWFKDIFGHSEREVSKWLNISVYDVLSAEGNLSAPSARGILFLPYLIGERCPHSDPDARGVFVGLGLHHSRNDIVRSIFEGIVFSLRDVYRHMEELGFKISQIRISGGGARSELFRKLHADIFDSKVVTVRHGEEGGSYGAGILAGVGAGFWSSVKEAARFIRSESETQVTPENTPVYRDCFAIYRSLYDTLKATFKVLGRN
ncbi:MAG TPA: xylulokinase [Atribacteraceae bacterium]|nr:xylulokinase [Atribacteraceae bacterium]